jgi:two-component system response regulator (stage 0 sporulation protein F)
VVTEGLGRILIVDDEKPVLDVLSEYFLAQGYAVHTAVNGSEALVAVQQQRPDLVLLDVRMPEIDGVEVLRRLRRIDDSLAVIMVTANEDLDLARETLKIGAFDYVSKPFDFRYLDRAVAAGLVQSGSSPEHAAPWPEPAEDPWRRLAVTVFQTVRAMSPIARASTGERLEAAVLDAARESTAGRGAIAAQRLGEVELLLGIAADLGDLSIAARATIERALGVARKAVGAG